MSVLILILLENALRLFLWVLHSRRCTCLNPYFVGKCSTARGKNLIRCEIAPGLNPYFVGKCSTAWSEKCNGRSRYLWVLILILLENALRPLKISFALSSSSSLNPYFVGKCSTAWSEKCNGRSRYLWVLILILLENALRRRSSWSEKCNGRSVLILILLENALRPGYLPLSSNSALRS